MMKMTKSWKPCVGLLGIIFLMMTAVSVSAAEPIERGAVPQGDTGAVATMDTEGNGEPILIATGDFANNETTGLPDYGNYTGDQLISPAPQTNTEKAAPFSLPILGVLGAVAALALAGIAVVVIRRHKK
jgi:hypothetical protein